MSRLRNLRLNRVFTQMKMQKLTGIHQSQLSKFETGKSVFRTRHIIPIALALDTSIDYLLGLTDQEKPHVRKK